MIFNSLHESEDVNNTNDIDTLAGTSADDEDAMAQEVENAMMSGALEEMSYFNGGEETQKQLLESVEMQALLEARKMGKNTYVRLGKQDDLTRRAHLASLVLARNAKDPLFDQLAKNRVKERKLRNQIFTKYKNKAQLIAKKSQKKHVKTAKALPATIRMV